MLWFILSTLYCLMSSCSCLFVPNQSRTDLFCHHFQNNKTSFITVTPRISKSHCFLPLKLRLTVTVTPMLMNTIFPLRLLLPTLQVMYTVSFSVFCSYRHTTRLRNTFSVPICQHSNRDPRSRLGFRKLSLIKNNPGPTHTKCFMDDSCRSQKSSE